MPATRFASGDGDIQNLSNENNMNLNNNMKGTPNHPDSNNSDLNAIRAQSPNSVASSSRPQSPNSNEQHHRGYSCPPVNYSAIIVNNDNELELPLVPKPTKPYTGKINPKGPAGRRYREVEKIMKSLPSPQWLLESEDFFENHRQRPVWDAKVTLFNNLGMCQQYRSYFDRWRDRASDYIPNVGSLKSTWLIGNPCEGDNGTPHVIKNKARKILWSSVHRSRTPSSKYITDSSYQPVKRWHKEVQRPDLIGGTNYGSKYNDVTHPNFREYFGVHKKHKTLDASVNESLSANVRASRVAAKKIKLEQHQAMLMKKFGTTSLPPLKNRNRSNANNGPGLESSSSGSANQTLQITDGAIASAAASPGPGATLSPSSSSKKQRDFRQALRDWSTPIVAVNPSPRHRSHHAVALDQKQTVKDALGHPEVLENSLFKDAGWVDRMKASF